MKNKLLAVLSAPLLLSTPMVSNAAVPASVGTAISAAAVTMTADVWSAVEYAMPILLVVMGIGLFLRLFKRTAKG